MNLLTTIPFQRLISKTPRQIESSSWDQSKQIHQKEVNLFCWKRPLDIVISSYLAQLLEKDLSPIVFHSSLEELAQKINDAQSEWDHGPKKAADRFWDDVQKLIAHFFHLAETTSGTIHLKVIDNNSCAKFHTDGYSLRLFTTYVGKGTQWLPEKATNRKGLGKTNELIIKDPSQVQQMEPFEVGILKGEVSHLPTHKGIVHRSPPINGTGEKRLILRVDV